MRSSLPIILDMLPHVIPNADAIAILPGFLLIAALVIGFFVPGTVSQFDRVAGLTPIGRAHHFLAVVAVAAIAVHAVYLGPFRRKRRRR